MPEGWTLSTGRRKSQLAPRGPAGFNQRMSSLIVIEIDDLRGTRALALALGELLQEGETILLEGPLGAGKTSLSRELLYALGVGADEAITSPTFALVHEYEGRAPLVHADLYRLSHADELAELGLDELSEEGAIALIEWGLRFEDSLSEVVLLIELDFIDPGESESRIARLRARSPRGEEILSGLLKELSSEHEGADALKVR